LTGSTFIVLGKIVGAYGVQGWVRVHPFADDPSSWGRMKAWQLGHEGEAPETWREVVPLRSKLQSDGLLVQLEGVTDRTAAEALKGSLVGAAREALPATGKDEYYWADLIGLDVVNGRDERLGAVKELIESASSDVLVVVADDGTERLLPFVNAVVIDVDVAAKRIRVEWEADW
jgi:16S rRNA processing protein RimM